MNKKKCYLCNNAKFEQVEGKVRDNDKLHILKCANCGLVFLENFDHINETFYNESQMRKGDINREWNNHINECSADDSCRAEWIKPLITNKSLLDFGCGGGGFLLKIIHLCSIAEGIEKDNYFRNILKNDHKINVYEDVDECKKQFDIITLFHVLEHLKDPKETLIKLAKRIKTDGTIYIEVPNANDALLSLYKNKPFSEFTYWSCHLFLFTNFTLKKMIIDSGLKLNYIKQIQRYPLSNHLYWLSQGSPGGHKVWEFIDSESLKKQYELQLANLGIADTLIASVSL